MTLISLLIVMALERVTSKAPEWHIHALAGRYIKLLQSRSWFSQTASLLNILLIVRAPALAVFLIDRVIDNGFFTFICM